MLGACAAPKEQPSARTTVIVNAQVADGTGAALRTANVRIVGDRIERIGAFEPQSNDAVIDARGLVLAPGFIDMHNHSDEAPGERAACASRDRAGHHLHGARAPTAILRSPIGPWLEARRRDPASLEY